MDVLLINIYENNLLRSRLENRLIYLFVAKVYIYI